MSDNIFEPFDAVKFGWDRLRGNLQFFAVLMIIVGAIYYLPSAISMVAVSPELFFSPDPVLSDSALVFVLILSLISGLIYILMDLGLTRIALLIHDGKKPEVGDLFRSYPLFINYLVATIIYFLMVGVGLALLIVPGIYLALKYQPYGYLVVDKGMGPIEALKESSRLTKGALKNLFVFWLTLYCSILVVVIIFTFFIALPAGFLIGAISKELLVAFNIALSLINSIINLIIIVPIMKLSTAYIYRILEGRASPSLSADVTGSNA